MLERLIKFLQIELQVSVEAICLARKTQDLEPNTLPIVLWQYGLLNAKQLDEVFERGCMANLRRHLVSPDWLEAS